MPSKKAATPPKKDATPAPPQVELCRASYRAHQIGNELLLFASGVHPTTGFKEFFSVRSLAGPTAQFAFFCIKPGGIVLEVITPFQHNERFQVEGPIEGVEVVDADGTHLVKVERSQQKVGAVPAPGAKAVLEEEVGCNQQVRNTVGDWANNHAFTDDQPLKDIYQQGPCNNGALSVLAQTLQQQFGTSPDGLSCSTTVRQIINFTC
ncbi:MAG TPA: hypothetical protein VGR07_05455 [Thermoanaerobaculia bacterium]|jgi:hypothetical protein|nr:hypothetical protein [Thermoanaerobaculia bacterium]